MRRVLLKNEMEMVRYEAVVILFEVISRHVWSDYGKSRTWNDTLCSEQHLKPRLPIYDAELVTNA